jgi:hypothetical protein
VKLIKNFQFYGTRRFIPLLTRALHWSLSWARSIQPKQTNPIPLIHILILSTHLCLGLRSGLFPSGFPTNILYEFLSPSTHVTCPAHLILLNLIILSVLGEDYKLRSSSLCNFLQPPVTSPSSVQLFFSAPRSGACWTRARNGTLVRHMRGKGNYTEIHLFSLFP